jgi:hypothetical protein
MPTSATPNPPVAGLKLSTTQTAPKNTSGRTTLRGRMPSTSRRSMAMATPA